MDLLGCRLRGLMYCQWAHTYSSVCHSLVSLNADPRKPPGLYPLHFHWDCTLAVLLPDLQHCLPSACSALRFCLCLLLFDFSSFPFPQHCFWDRAKSWANITVSETTNKYHLRLSHRGINKWRVALKKYSFCLFKCHILYDRKHLSCWGTNINSPSGASYPIE